MARTTNYELYVTDDGTVDFDVWQQAISGETNSNFTIIDEALASKGDGIIADAQNNTLQLTVNGEAVGEPISYLPTWGTF